MRRWPQLFLIALVLLAATAGLSGCGAGIEGTWTMRFGDPNGEKPDSVPGVTFIINNDGTLVARQSVESTGGISGTWEETDEGEVLIAIDQGAEMRYRKVGSDVLAEAGRGDWTWTLWRE